MVTSCGTHRTLGFLLSENRLVRCMRINYGPKQGILSDREPYEEGHSKSKDFHLAEAAFARGEGGQATVALHRPDIPSFTATLGKERISQ